MTRRIPKTIVEEPPADGRINGSYKIDWPGLRRVVDAAEGRWVRLEEDKNQSYGHDLRTRMGPEYEVVGRQIRADDPARRCYFYMRRRSDES